MSEVFTPEAFISPEPLKPRESLSVMRERRNLEARRAADHALYKTLNHLETTVSPDSPLEDVPLKAPTYDIGYPNYQTLLSYDGLGIKPEAFMKNLGDSSDQRELHSIQLGAEVLTTETLGHGFLSVHYHRLDADESQDAQRPN